MFSAKRKKESWRFFTAPLQWFRHEWENGASPFKYPTLKSWTLALGNLELQNERAREDGGGRKWKGKKKPNRAQPTLPCIRAAKKKNLIRVRKNLSLDHVMGKSAKNTDPARYIMDEERGGGGVVVAMLFSGFSPPFLFSAFHQDFCKLCQKLRGPNPPLFSPRLRSN